jgi:hypothetical protein
MAARIFNKLPAVLKVFEEDQIFERAFFCLKNKSQIKQRGRSWHYIGL